MQTCAPRWSWRRRLRWPTPTVCSRWPATTISAAGSWPTRPERSRGPNHRRPTPSLRCRPMRLDQVLPGAAPAGARDLQISGLAYDNRLVAPGTLFFCVPGFTRDGHDFAPDAVARGGCAGRRAPARARGAPGAGRVGPGGDGPGGGRVLRRPDEPTADRRGDRDERQDDERLPRAGAAGGRRPSDRPAGNGQERDRRRRARRRADDPGGDRPAAHVPDDGRCRRPGVRDGGLLARAGAAPRRRDPLRRRDLHQPHPGPPRLPSDDGGLLQRQAAAVLRRRASGGVRDQRRRPLRGAARRRARRAGHVRAARRARRLPRHERANRSRWLDVHRGHAR